MDIKDEDLKKFCLEMKESKKRHYSNGMRDDDLASFMLQDMQKFIKNNPSFAELESQKKKSLAEVLSDYAPLRTEHWQNNYHRHYQNKFIIDIPQPPIIVVAGNTGHSSRGCGDIPAEVAMFIAGAIIVFVGFVATIKACIDFSIYVDAIANNEGRTRAIFNTLMLAGLFAAAAALTVSFLLATIAAGNVSGFAVLIVASLSAIGAYSTYWILARVMDMVTPHIGITNPDNPYKDFTMTKKDADRLEGKGIDSLKVRTIIMLLQSETSSNAPTWDNQAQIQQIRDLRFGRTRKIEIDSDTTLNCEPIPTAEAVLFNPFVIAEAYVISEGAEAIKDTRSGIPSAPFEP